MTKPKTPTKTGGGALAPAPAPIAQILPTHIMVRFTIVTPDQLRRIIFMLTKDTTAATGDSWSISFQLDERTDATKAFALSAKFDVEVDHEDHPNAEATAKHGMDSDQVDQAHVAADTTKDVQAGAATDQDRKDATKAVISARNDASPK